MAWNPKFTGGLLGKLFGNNKTVIRGGYGRILRPSQRREPAAGSAAASGSAAGRLLPRREPHRRLPGQQRRGPEHAPSASARTVTTAPLPAVSQTLPQPYLPGRRRQRGRQRRNWLDPNYRPERTDNVTITVQRQIPKRMTLEVGYVGRIIRNEMLARNLDAVPYMTTLGGQSFADAYRQDCTSR